MNEEIELDLADTFAGQFMRPEIWQTGYYQVNTSAGTEYVPADVIKHLPTTNAGLQAYLEGKPDEPDEPVTVSFGWLARLSAPGYMDCTDWSVHSSEDEAAQYLIDTYGE